MSSGTDKTLTSPVFLPDTNDRSILRRLSREPLLHFLLIGSVLFGADRWFRSPADDMKTIVVTKTMQSAFIRGFDEDGVRKPTPQQLKNMIDAWVASEILYREGKALGVDKGDDMIRDRIAFKLQVLVFDQVQLERPTTEVLRGYFEANRNRFDRPETVSFLVTSTASEAAAQQNFEAIKAQREPPDLRETTRVFANRPVTSIAPVFGQTFADNLLHLPVGEWRVLKAQDGWHVVRLDVHQPAQAADFDLLRDQVEGLWRTEETRRRAWAAVEKLKANYTVKIEN